MDADVFFNKLKGLSSKPTALTVLEIIEKTVNLSRAERSAI
ncbi:hypothetical protein [Siminovitchia fortis]|nr:hypothetical protein [Siminovitchia fortis]